MKNKNEGFTLVELIVVIAIMAVLSGTFAYSLRLIGRQRVSNASANMKTTLQLAQTYAKSKKDCYVKLVGQPSGEVEVSICVTDEKGNEIIGTEEPQLFDRKVETKVLFKGDSDPIPIKNGDVVRIYFNRKTGGFESSYKPDNSTGIPAQIIFTNGAKTSTLKLASYTGLVSIE